MPVQHEFVSWTEYTRPLALRQVAEVDRNLTFFSHAAELLRYLAGATKLGFVAHRTIIDACAIGQKTGSVSCLVEIESGVVLLVR